ncbi:MAG TPA: TlpA disulfide reductase family protein [Steroidobacteraceae bacterium]|nr:TlpA disulfide reductase family protein [Steroidobacteraceae bacterium]
MSGRRATAPRTLAVAAVLLASGALGFLWQRLTAPASSTLRVAAPSPAAAVAAPSAPPAALPERRVPESLPDFSLPGMDGVLHRLSDWRGHPLVVNFWATWCDPCRREIPLLVVLRREHRREGLEVVGIAVDFREPVEKFARHMGIDYPVLIGDKGGLEAVASFGMDTVLPFSVFADRRGRIVTLKVGELHRDEANLILENLRALDAGRLGLPEAREQIDAGVRRLAASRAGSPAAAAQ